jgi:hypothetical protein
MTEQGHRKGGQGVSEMNDQVTPQDCDENSSSPDGQTPEAFTTVPHAFLSGLSPERFRATQQLYETAFEMARQKIARENAEVDWTDERWLGDGI